MKNFQVKHGQYDSIIFPDTFSFGRFKYLLDLPLGDNMILLTQPGIYPQVYHRTPCPAVLIVRRSKKQQRRDGIISNFTKGETFFISYNNQVLLEVISRFSHLLGPSIKRSSSPLHSLAKKGIYLDTPLKKERTYLFESCQGVLPQAE